MKRFICTLPFLAALLFPTQTLCQVLFDFEGNTKLTDEWTASGKIQASRTDVENGKALHISAGDKFAIYSKSGLARVNDFENAETISFRVRSQTDKLNRLDLIALEGDRKALFWTKIMVKGKNWQSVKIPLRWFRWESLRAPNWSRVKSLGFRGSKGVDVWIDDISIQDEHVTEGAYATIADYESLMTNGSPEACRSFCDDELWLFTDAPDLDADVLRQQLKSVRETYLKQIPIDKAYFDEPPKMFVFGDRTSYQQFSIRYSKKLNGVGQAPQTSGCHLQGLATSFYDADLGSVRSVFAHEFVHSMNSFYLRLDSSKSDWLQEGLATFYQLKTTPQKGVSDIIQTGLDKADFRTPLSKLTNGKSIRLNRYWQAATFIHFLMTDERVSPKWPKLLERVRLSGSVDLGRHLEAVYEISFDELEAQWLEHARNNIHVFD